MKQHITIEQLDELSKEGKTRLDIWYHDECSHRCEEIETDISRHPLPILSIGQMIEFLDEERKTILFITKLECGHDNFVWSTGSMSCMGNHTQDKTESKRLHDAGKELCDALWEAVKKELNK